MGLFNKFNASKERDKQAQRNRNLRELERKLAGDGWWTCMRCGTSNQNVIAICKKCRNRRPF